MPVGVFPPRVLLLAMISNFFNLVIMLAMRPAKTPVAILLMSLNTAPKPACLPAYLPACLPVDLTQLDTSLNTAPKSVALDATLNTIFNCHLKSLSMPTCPPFELCIRKPTTHQPGLKMPNNSRASSLNTGYIVFEYTINVDFPDIYRAAYCDQPR